MTPALIPETAPFNDEQRAWLNGFFAGFLGIQSAMAAKGAADTPASGASATAVHTAPAIEPSDYPWHDPALEISERIQLAEGKPMQQQLMAAMAQLDCGSCGYLCNTYSAAIAAGHVKNLTLCTPGGQPTSRMIKQILKTQSTVVAGLEAAAAPVKSVSPSSGPSSGPAVVEGYSRSRPFSARLLESRALNRPGSMKDTRHVVLELSGAGLTYNVGDALGVFPTNCPDLVDQILQALKCDGLTKLPAEEGLSVRDYLITRACLKGPTDELLELLMEHTCNESAKKTLEQILNDGPEAGFDVFDAVASADPIGIAAETFVRVLNSLQPRLYSIASSQRAVGDNVHLTVGKVNFELRSRLRKGVASTMFAERVTSGETVRVFVHPNHGGFTVPKDPNVPMIMVGPGTGIAPFIAFLQEREARQAPGKNWLFFGDQRQEYDFLYEHELQKWISSRVLTRLDVAFSRDRAEKVYVQDRMRQLAKELWMWLENGAHFYVCGDASRMAADVDRALREIIAAEGKLSTEEATTYITRLQQQQRYVRDIY